MHLVESYASGRWHWRTYGTKKRAEEAMDLLSEAGHTNVCQRRYTARELAEYLCRMVNNSADTIKELLDKEKENARSEVSPENRE